MRARAVTHLAADRKRLSLAVGYLDRILEDDHLVAEERSLFLSTAETITRWASQSLRATMREGIE